MDITSITTIISTVGFPIACVIYLFYFINKRDEKQDVKDQQMQEILTNFSLNIQENTLLIKELIKESSDKDENK